MCGRYTLTQEMDSLQLRFNFKATKIKKKPSYNIAPSQKCLVIVAEKGEYYSKEMQWGLIPKWHKPGKAARAPINARAESIAEKPSFRSLVNRRRCLVPADSWFEWKSKPGQKNKVPMRILFKKEELFAFAGLWDTSEDANSKALETFTIITTEANEICQPIHHRMPVIISKVEEKVWLSDVPLKDIESLLAPCSSEWLRIYPVSTIVNSPKNNSPKCLTEVQKPEEQQGRLW